MQKIAQLPLAIIVVCGLVVPTRPVSVIPSLAPLQYITPPVIASYIGSDVVQPLLDKAEKTVLSALLPVDQEDALAIFISEGVSGSFGGLVGKLVAVLDGNKNNKKMSGFSNAGTFGAYFGKKPLSSIYELAV
jgi:hypothetical protein